MTKSSKPKNVRQGLTTYEPGAHLYASFVTHWKGGVASMIPFGVLYFTTQPFEQAMTTLATGGFTIGPAIIGITALAWALMSMAVLQRLRFRDSLRLHLLVYAITGAVVLLTLAMVALTLVQGLKDGVYDPSTSDAFSRMLIGAPIVGALGSVIGRWTIDSGTAWHRMIVREPLPDVFTFVEGKRDKDEFKRM
jgi:uncharacterized membrane protein YeaQ/YmgE (transglycosylase-associated protein family)